MDNEERDDEVGYGKPPKHTQFKKGQCGNPNGRPKGTLNIATAVAKALSEPVVINQNGARKTITKLQAVITQLVNQAAQGNLRAIQQLSPLVRFSEEQSAQAKANDARSVEQLTDAELDEILEPIARELHKSR